MECRLVGVAQHRRVLEPLERHAFGLLRGGADFARRRIFLVALIARFLRFHAHRREQECVEPAEIAADAESVHVLFNARDCRFLALLEEPGSFFAAQLR